MPLVGYFSASLAYGPVMTRLFRCGSELLWVKYFHSGGVAYLSDCEEVNQVVLGVPLTIVGVKTLLFFTKYDSFVTIISQV